MHISLGWDVIQKDDIILNDFVEAFQSQHISKRSGLIDRYLDYGNSSSIRRTYRVRVYQLVMQNSYYAFSTLHQQYSVSLLFVFQKSLV